MLKKSCMLLVAAALSTASCLAVNKAYRAFSETSVFTRHEGSKAIKDRLITVEKGDTVYTNDETLRYLREEEYDDVIPVEYKGVHGYIELSYLYPIKLSTEDVLTFDQTKKPEDRTIQERVLVPQMEWAINHTSGPLMWFYLIMISVAIGVAGSILLESGRQPLYYTGLVTMGISLTVASAAEILYILAFHNQVLWFIKPSFVGGWGHTILNFCIMSAVLGIQSVLYYMMWDRSFYSDVTDQDTNHDEGDDDDDETIPKWLPKLALLPLPLGFFLIILTWVDYARDSTMSAETYLYSLATICVAALIGLIFQFRNKRPLQGLVFPAFYVTGGIGLVCAVMIFSALIIFVAAAAVIFGLIAMSAIGLVCGALFGKRKVDFIDENGNKQSGFLNNDSTIDGDNGNKYILK